MYDGREPEKYAYFRRLLGAKLQINSKAIGSPYNCMWYASARLAGLAADTIIAWTDIHAIPAAMEEILKQMLAHMDAMFEDKNRTERAIRKLSTLNRAIIYSKTC
jgi:hypothetical protein